MLLLRVEEDEDAMLLVYSFNARGGWRNRSGAEVTLVLAPLLVNFPCRSAHPSAELSRPSWPVGRATRDELRKDMARSVVRSLPQLLRHLGFSIRLSIAFKSTSGKSASAAAALCSMTALGREVGSALRAQDR
jgi:hypothetical protein